MDELRPGDPRQLGSYAIVGSLGAGGMGRVYLGRSRAGRPVAIKVIRPDLADDPEFRERFAREVAAARTVSGAFTAPVIDADPRAERPWLATAYVPGPSLQKAIEDFGPLPTSSAAALGAGIAEALAAVHAAGVVHRDLKPSNILLAADGPRVIDFGIARSAENVAMTTTGELIGTAGFTAPEQLTHARTGIDPIGPAADVFALGAVLTVVTTGVGPFGRGSVVEIHARVLHNAPALNGVPPVLRDLVSRCLARDPRHRPSVHEVLASLTAGGATMPDLSEPGWLPPPLTQAIQSAPSFPGGTGSDYRALTPPSTRPPYQGWPDVSMVTPPPPAEGGTPAVTPLPSRPTSRRPAILAGGSLAVAAVASALLLRGCWTGPVDPVVPPSPVITTTSPAKQPVQPPVQPVSSASVSVDPGTAAQYSCTQNVNSITNAGTRHVDLEFHNRSSQPVRIYSHDGFGTRVGLTLRILNPGKDVTITDATSTKAYEVTNEAQICQAVLVPSSGSTEVWIS
ncbi:serine/threonine protein kinase [Frankia sp. AgB1.9]|uniref:serine/threonine-protein kinase n=1 Tax=unclassified Frankia TaxID=2632575 RepID=UPI001931882D|nr:MULTISPECIES: serine/threonine-protein kinase [unclassified Frankia]MBL7488382.1 serine/threonine protein kinase [Frankia sp. AgW1.1]MBL7547670.1 serine/threonine protein kinase [Frankia sp. AgB1.9]MBL7624085.1 serine/threonine protein kinase [Frankia sp. AgB1.8]